MPQTRAGNYCAYRHLNVTRLGVKIDSASGTCLYAFPAPVTSAVVQDENTGKAPVARSVYCFVGKHAGVSRHIYLHRADCLTLPARIAKRPPDVFALLPYGNCEIARFPSYALYTTISHKSYQRVARDLYHRAVSLLTDGHITDPATRSGECPVQQCDQPTACGR